MARGSVAPRDETYNYQDEQGEGWAGRLLLDALEVAVITTLIFLIARVFVQNYQVDGPSMTPTLLNSQYILVNKADYYLHTPQRGDVIVFRYPRDPSRDFVKRVIGVPGDTVTVSGNGIVIVDGVRLAEPYTNDQLNYYGPGRWTLSAGQYFVLGDNRGDSSDSRDWGPVPQSDIIGKAELVYWPLPDAHALKDWSGTFSGISTGH
ncbi:MAG TPA: signal peptidase I [Ktedonobacterales bacterium]|jgi:signal peptidase I|nr:signal peptidase I [Ktedonobacterales bacterium]